MFEQFAEYFWIALFAALVLYGLGNAIQVPFLVKKFYRKKDFEDHGKSTFDEAPLVNSKLLKGFQTPNVYSGSYRNHRVSQFAAYSVNRRKLTMNKAIRKNNQLSYTISIVHLETLCPVFCARPTRVTESPSYIFEEQGVLFPDDEGFVNKVHVMAEDHAAVRKLFTIFIRERLNAIDPVSLESLGTVLIYKSPRLPHDAGTTLEKDLTILIDIAEKIAITTSASDVKS